MTYTPTDDQPGFVAEEPEPCHDCCRVIRPGPIYFLTIEHAAHRPDGIRAAGAIRLAGGLTIEVGENRLQARRGRDTVAVLTSEGCWPSEA